MSKPEQEINWYQRRVQLISVLAFTDFLSSQGFAVSAWRAECWSNYAQVLLCWLAEFHRLSGTNHHVLLKHKSTEVLPELARQLRCWRSQRPWKEPAVYGEFRREFKFLSLRILSALSQESCFWVCHEDLQRVCCRYRWELPYVQKTLKKVCLFSGTL